MIPCPNCGAIARNGAKFCTTCGTKLAGIAPTPITQAATTTTTATTSASNGVEPTENPVWANWPPASEPPAEPAKPEPAPTTTTTATGADWQWPEQFAIAAPFVPLVTTKDESAKAETAGDIPASDPTPADNPHETGPSATSITPTTELDALAAWSANWSAEIPEDDRDTVEETTAEPNVPASTADAPEEEIVSGDPNGADATTEPTSAPAPMEQTLSEHTADSQAEALAARDEREEEQGSVAPEASESEWAVEPETHDAPPVSVSESSATGADAVGTGDALPISASAATRATALLDELRTLLAAHDAATTDAALPIAVAADLRDALGSETSYEALREAATQANANPRDLYAMMDLGRHTGDILALLAERDRLRAALVGALSPQDRDS